MSASRALVSANGCRPGTISIGFQCLLTNERAQQLQYIMWHACPEAVAARQERCKHSSILTAAVKGPAWCSVR
jgi:hypothetical protein